MEKEWNEKERLILYDKAVTSYGIYAQKWVMVEEMGELINALAKANRNRSNRKDIITELADVSIMVEQMAYFYGFAIFRDEKKRKLNILENRLKKEQNPNDYEEEN